MLPVVLPQIPLLRERLVSDGACVRLSTHMHANMIFEVPLLLKDFVASFELSDELLDLPAGLRVGKVLDLVRVDVQEVLVVLLTRRVFLFEFGNLRFWK